MKSKDMIIFGYGAPAKGNVLLNYCKFDHKILDFITDTTNLKQGKFTPGTHIPIKKPLPDILKNINYAYLGAWNFKSEIFEKEKVYIETGGKFITHVPKPMIL